jgi:outer membrane protein TolC
MRLNFLISGVFCASCLLAQEAPSFPSAAYFRDHFTTPKTRVELRPPVRLQDFVVDGKLELSLRSYLELVMANNTDISIQRLSLEIPKNAILRAFGTFDPTFTGTFDATRQKSASTSALAGANLLNALTQRATTGYTQRLENGTQFTVGFNGSKDSSNNAFATVNPALNASLRFGFAQPLLRDRGGYVTRLPIMIARSQLRKSEYDLRDTLTRLIATSETTYWDVIESRERLKVQEEYLKLSEVALKRAQRELELGALSPLDIFRPQQQYATAEIQVSQFRFQLAQREDALRRQIGADLDPEIRKLPIVLTETVSPALETASIDQEAAVEKALARRPDLRSSLQTLDVDELRIKQSTNALRPDLSLTASYSAQGRGGMLYDRTNVFGQSQLVKVTPGGFGDALDQLFGFGLPTYQFGLTLRLPLRDRSRSADLADTLIQKRLDSLRARSIEQQIRLDVLNGINQVESSKAAVALAKVAVEFAQKQVDAEQKKYDLGTNIMYFVLQAQTDLASAQSTLVTQSINYRRSLLTLLRYTGELLEERGVAVQ